MAFPRSELDITVAKSYNNQVAVVVLNDFVISASAVKPRPKHTTLLSSERYATFAELIRSIINTKHFCILASQGMSKTGLIASATKGLSKHLF